MTEIGTNPAPKSNKTRIILIAAGIFVLLCAVVCAVIFFVARKAATELVKMDPGEAENLASKITDYELPSGFEAAVGTEIANIIMVGFINETTESTIFLAQSPVQGSLSTEEMLSKIGGPNNNNPISWTPIDVRQYTIRGEESSIAVYEGTRQDGEEYTAWGGKFNGKGGEALVLIYSSAAEWDDSLAENFINSLR
jgi:hypothetical protein